MNLDFDICYQAMLSRDRRFDGWFLTGVTSTGIYCRPICRVRKPRRENCRFFADSAAAEQAGFRPCLRCRPERAPGLAMTDMSARLAQSAAALIESGFLDDASIAELARRIGVSDRHLRRIFEAHFGVSIGRFVQTRRLLLAKRLLTETRLPMTELSLAAGFGSQRRFNALFRHSYGLTPSALRRTGSSDAGAPLCIELAYRPPLCWSALLSFLAPRAIEGVEWIEGEHYARTVAIERRGQWHHGWVRVSHVPERHALSVTLPASLHPVIAGVLSRVRRLFDLDCSPEIIDDHLGALAAARPGVRVPGAFDGFEMAVRAIAGQQIRVTQARRILSRLVEQFGEPVAGAPAGLRVAFPEASRIAGLDPEALIGLGLLRQRAEAIIALSREIVAQRLSLAPLMAPDDVLPALRAIRGIGEWTVQYIAMRSLAWPDAFPHGDAVLKKRLGLTSAKALEQYAERWSPWRAYAAIRLWEDAPRSGPVSLAEEVTSP
ncbi:DNA-3-methyladenine glycosylase 2 [Kushneria phosphatilytica]|uniref:DNA-3-methyladenine glycosylase II n=1 Tax=Kushneria phosphatilytica TaxID=657387 RepID=A0A1S1NN81_9GAMM|nr:DNA-3-methyladenine glycosylase 2 [Kushneria phosphatilytica]OHV08732.1 adenosine deaminase [Kushneria phosphatilytica]QEL12456.1 DNA-3-methyladenine glycosylase 2 [Kushneria phosphatilytica]